MQTITVTIGRNVGSEPMPQDAWNGFVFEVKGLLADTALGEVWASSAGKGTWDGVTEESYVVYGPLASTADLGKLRSGLSNLATYYNQDAIGLSVGESGLVYGWNKEGIEVAG